MIPDQIELDLAALKEPENLDRVEHIQQLLRQILYSPEMTPAADASGEWTLDYNWAIDLPKVMMRKTEAPTLHGGRRGR